MLRFFRQIPDLLSFPRRWESRFILKAHFVYLDPLHSPGDDVKFIMEIQYA